MISDIVLVVAVAGVVVLVVVVVSVVVVFLVVVFVIGAFILLLLMSLLLWLVPLALWVPREQTGEYMQEQPREQPQEQPRELFIRIRGTRCRRSWCSAPAFLWDALTATCACTSTELQRARARVSWRRMEGVLDEEGGEGARAQGGCG